MEQSGPPAAQPTCEDGPRTPGPQPRAQPRRQPPRTASQQRGCVPAEASSSVHTGGARGQTSVQEQAQGVLQARGWG